MDSIVIIGYRGVGKSTIGRRLASLLDMPFVDSDEEILRIAGKPSVQSIWDEGGEGAWRAIEGEIVLELLQDGGIIALGGGAPMNQAIKSTLCAHERVLYLSAPLEVLRERLQRSSDRPTLNQDDDAMLKLRTPIYNECASVEIDASGTLEETMSVIETALQGLQ